MSTVISLTGKTPNDIMYLIMDSFFPIVIAIISVVLFIILLMGILSANKKIGKNHKKKGRASIIKEATRLLSQDSHNVDWLLALSSLYFEEHLWDKALPLLETLLDISVARHEIDIADVGLKQGICAINLEKVPESLRGLLLARKLRPDNMEINFYLGKAFYLNHDYEKAVPLMKKALTVNSEFSEGIKFYGLSLYHSQKAKESLPFLRKALDIEPENKELLFSLADAMSEAGMQEKALKVFMHLRPDEEYGARACQAAGMIHANMKQNDKAILDFEIGLKIPTIPNELAIDIRYRLAQCYFATREMGKGLAALKEIQAFAPNYKDVNTLVTRYSELNQNKNLQVYLIGSASDFVALCRRIVLSQYENSSARIMDIQVQSVYTEILAEIETPKWEDVVIFRFFRTTGVTGEMFIRDFHGRIHEAKAGKGICVTAGTFSEESRKYIEGRPIDLIEKDALIKVLKKIDTAPAFKL